MLITLDGVVTEEQPTSMTWSRERDLGNDGIGRPRYGPYRRCSLQFERMTTTEFHQWFEASEDGESHDVRLPHPESGVSTEYSCYVHVFAPRMNNRWECEGVAAGVDITLSRIEVE